MEYIKNIEYELKKYKNIDQKNIKLNLKELKKHIRNHNKIMKGKGTGFSSCIKDTSEIPKIPIEFKNLSEFENLKYEQILTETIFKKEKHRIFLLFENEHILLSNQISETIDVLIYTQMKIYVICYYEKNNRLKKYYLKILSILQYIFYQLLQFKENNFKKQYFKDFNIYVDFILYCLKELEIYDMITASKTQVSRTSVCRTSAKNISRKGNKIIEYKNKLNHKRNIVNDIMDYIDDFSEDQIITKLKHKYPDIVLQLRLNTLKSENEELIKEQEKELKSRLDKIKSSYRSSTKL